MAKLKSIKLDWWQKVSGKNRVLIIDKSLIIPQINHINEFIRPQLVPNSLIKEEFAK